MNYIWDLIIEVERRGILKKQLKFVKAKRYSPYMELSFEDLNKTVLDENESHAVKGKKKRNSKAIYEIEVNPYYRFYEIFRDMYSLDDSEHEELKEVLFDLLIHHLSDTDAYMGMNKWEFYKGLLLDDIKNNFFGKNAYQQFLIFTEVERQYLLTRILMLYEVGESLLLFKETIHTIFNNSAIYINRREKDEILIYLGVSKSKRYEEKLTFILDFFLPVKYEIRLYWDKHFGVIGEDKTMHVNQIVLY
ncbi:hypothetical protein [Anaerosporobacter sp.]|uniref:hypothetical protein n=1 Tax=Anaerosporobacter sp. TaxID=1872529 RepID=UPI00286F1687|nr:hypothetical protein [Anaerosporobacter sp.]